MDKKVGFTVGITGLAYVVNYLVYFVLASYITEKISIEAYGYVTLSKTIVSYLLIATMALNSYAIRNISLEFYNKNYKKANSYFNSVLFGNIFIALLVFVLGLMLVLFGSESLGISPDIKADVLLLSILVIVNFGIEQIGMVFQSSSYVMDKLIYVAIIKLIGYLMEIIVLFLLFYFLPVHLYYIGIGMIASSLINITANYYITRRFTPAFQCCHHDFNLSFVKELLKNGVWNSFNSIGTTLNSGLDLIFAKLLLDDVSMGQISVIKIFTDVFSVLFQMISRAFYPALLKFYAEGDRKRLVFEIRKSMRVSGLFANIYFSLIIALGFNLYKVWMPKQNIELLYSCTVIAVLYSIFEGSVTPLYHVYNFTLKNKIPCIITFMGGIVNVCSMIFLFKTTNLGIFIVFITTSVILMTINAIAVPLYSAKCLKVSWYSFCPTLVIHIIVTIMSTVACVFIVKMLHPQSWITLFAVGLVCTVTAISLYSLFALDKNEKSAVFKKVIKTILIKLHLCR